MQSTSEQEACIEGASALCGSAACSCYDRIHSRATEGSEKLEDRFVSFDGTASHSKSISTSKDKVVSSVSSEQVEGAVKIVFEAEEDELDDLDRLKAHARSGCDGFLLVKRKHRSVVEILEVISSDESCGLGTSGSPSGCGQEGEIVEQPEEMDEVISSNQATSLDASAEYCCRGGARESVYFNGIPKRVGENSCMISTKHLRCDVNNDASGDDNIRSVEDKQKATEISGRGENVLLDEVISNSCDLTIDDELVMVGLIAGVKNSHVASINNFSEDVQLNSVAKCSCENALTRDGGEAASAMGEYRKVEKKTGSSSDLVRLSANAEPSRASFLSVEHEQARIATEQPEEVEEKEVSSDRVKGQDNSESHCSEGPLHEYMEVSSGSDSMQSMENEHKSAFTKLHKKPEESITIFMRSTGNIIPSFQTEKRNYHPRNCTLANEVMLLEATTNNADDIHPVEKNRLIGHASKMKMSKVMKATDISQQSEVTDRSNEAGNGSDETRSAEGSHEEGIVEFCCKLSGNICSLFDPIAGLEKMDLLGKSLVTSCLKRAPHSSVLKNVFGDVSPATSEEINERKYNKLLQASSKIHNLSLTRAVHRRRDSGKICTSTTIEIQCGMHKITSVKKFDILVSTDSSVNLKLARKKRAELSLWHDEAHSQANRTVTADRGLLLPSESSCDMHLPRHTIRACSFELRASIPESFSGHIKTIYFELFRESRTLGEDRTFELLNQYPVFIITKPSPTQFFKKKDGSSLQCLTEYSKATTKIMQVTDSYKRSFSTTSAYCALPISSSEEEDSDLSGSIEFYDKDTVGFKRTPPALCFMQEMPQRDSKYCIPTTNCAYSINQLSFELNQELTTRNFYPQDIQLLEGSSREYALEAPVNVTQSHVMKTTHEYKCKNFNFFNEEPEKGFENAEHFKRFISVKLLSYGLLKLKEPLLKIQKCSFCLRRNLGKSRNNPRILKPSSLILNSCGKGNISRKEKSYQIIPVSHKCVEQSLSTDEGTCNSLAQDLESLELLYSLQTTNHIDNEHKLRSEIKATFLEEKSAPIGPKVTSDSYGQLHFDPIPGHLTELKPVDSFELQLLCREGQALGIAKERACRYKKTTCGNYSSKPQRLTEKDVPSAGSGATKSKNEEQMLGMLSKKKDVEQNTAAQLERCSSSCLSYGDFDMHALVWGDEAPSDMNELCHQQPRQDNCSR